MTMNRRSMILTALTASAMHLVPGIGLAQAKRLVFATFQGSFEEAYRDVLVPVLRKNSGADITLDPQLAADMFAKVKASAGKPPFDVMMQDPGPSLQAVEQGLVEPYPVARSKHFADLIASAQLPNGPGIFRQAIGLTYNPETVKKPPTSWLDLWDRRFAGRVGITGPGNSMGASFFVEIARLHGGSEADGGPAFKALAKFKSDLAAIANPAALATLFQQGQIDIAPGSFNQIQVLKAQGVPVEFVVPTEGAVAYSSVLHIIKNTQQLDLAFALIEGALSPQVQTALMQEPYQLIPTNSKVKLSGAVSKLMPDDPAAQAKRFVTQDWAEINKHRPDWIQQFDRDMQR
jgi:putative spermidine/putrescine transport system substrate-binding protein